VYSKNSSQTRKIQITQASNHLSSTRGLLTRIGTRGTTLHGLRRPKAGFTMTCPLLEDSRGPWLVSQGIDNYIYKYIYNRQVEIESGLGSCSNQLGYLPCNLAPLDIKGGVEAPQRTRTRSQDKSNKHNNINCHEQYKNIGRRTIIIREA
jgi:hypothetical protein